MKLSKKKAIISRQCVACGCCVKVCPLGSISVYKGIRAVVNEQTCVGCGKCADACPGGIVSTVLREEAANEEKALV